MASREDLATIRSARAGKGEAQLALGRRYLFGGGGLPKSEATALHWLNRAAHQDIAQAWLTIGEYINYEVLQQTPAPLDFLTWYERAFDAGIKPAGLVFARLVLLHNGPADDKLQIKAIKALEVAAQAGIADAQWLLAQHAGKVVSKDTKTKEAEQQLPGHDISSSIDVPELLVTATTWAQKAADAGVRPAQLALASAAWHQGDQDTFLQRALPLARSLIEQYAHEASLLNMPTDAWTQRLGANNIELLSRLAKVLMDTADTNLEELQLILELAAYASDKEAQLALGLLFARMREDGTRAFVSLGSANYKKAIRWLTLAGEQGAAAAWYALSRIYLKTEFSQRNSVDAQHYLERAAQMGHMRAQLECGVSAWRSRREDIANDVRAVYWLQKAAAQGEAEAKKLLHKIAENPTPAAWAVSAGRQLTHEIVNAYPFLAARVELAQMFGLTRPEALLIDLKQADCGHCLVIDIRVHYTRSKRRLILVEKGGERQVLSRIGRLFEDVDCSLSGPEGNYRQRLYRLKTVLPLSAEE